MEMFIVFPCTSCFTFVTVVELLFYQRVIALFSATNKEFGLFNFPVGAL